MDLSYSSPKFLFNLLYYIVRSQFNVILDFLLLKNRVSPTLIIVQLFLHLDHLFLKSRVKVYIKALYSNDRLPFFIFRK